MAENHILPVLPVEHMVVPSVQLGMPAEKSTYFAHRAANGRVFGARYIAAQIIAW